jgi:hypothetical protein
MHRYIEFRCANTLGSEVCKGILPGPSTETLEHALLNGGFHSLTYCANCRQFVQIDIDKDAIPIFRILPKRSSLPLIPFDQIFTAGISVRHE